MEIKTGAEILSEYRNQEQNLSTFKALEELIDEELEKAKSFPLDAGVIMQPPRKKPMDENDKNELRKDIMRPFNGWYNYEIIEYLEWLITWNKNKARESAAEHSRLSR